MKKRNENISGKTSGTGVAINSTVLTAIPIIGGLIALGRVEQGTTFINGVKLKNNMSNS